MSNDDSYENQAEQESVQEKLEKAMPSFPEDRREFEDEDEIRMTTEEQFALTEHLEEQVQELYDRGFSPNELGTIFHGFSHRMNASRYDPHEFDRIALSIELRQFIEDWREEQDGDVPVLAIAEAVEEMGRQYRDKARKEVYKRQGRREAEEDAE